MESHSLALAGLELTELHLPQTQVLGLKTEPFCLAQYTCFSSAMEVFSSLPMGLFVLLCANIYLLVCVCVTCVRGARGSQNEVSYPLEMELQPVVGHFVSESWEPSGISARAAGDQLCGPAIPPAAFPEKLL